MAHLTVQKLNDDTTFLLAFAPSFTSSSSPTKPPSNKDPGAITLLLDPWLTGPEILLHPSFHLSHHTSPPSVPSLTDLNPQPDLIIISQAKPDHCHRATLCALPRNTTTKILAVPAAARKIRAWKHFDESVVHVLSPYAASDALQHGEKDGPKSSKRKREETLTRIPVPAYTSSSTPGELTIAHIVTKGDLTGLHTAIGITYRPPGCLLTAFREKRDETVAPRPLTSGAAVVQERRARSSHGKNTETKQRARAKSSPPLASRPVFLDPLGRDAPPLPTTRTDSAYASSNSSTSPSSVKPSLPPTSSEESEKEGRKARPITQQPTLSLLYTPHGMPPSSLQGYATSFLQPNAALPLTCLVHSMNQEMNPWMLGGKVCAGAPGGLEIVRTLGARYWVGAHDETKKTTGWATKWCRNVRWGPEQIEWLLSGTEVRVLGVGERLGIER